jgi:hypothetical protein
MELAGIRPGPLRRIRNYFRYGSVRALDPADTSVVLRQHQQLSVQFLHSELAARYQITTWPRRSA